MFATLLGDPQKLGDAVMTRRVWTISSRVFRGGGPDIDPDGGNSKFSGQPAQYSETMTERERLNATGIISSTDFMVGRSVD